MDGTLFKVLDTWQKSFTLCQSGVERKKKTLLFTIIFLGQQFYDDTKYCLVWLKWKKKKKKQYQILTPSCYLLANLFLTLTLQFLITDTFSSGYSFWSVKSFQIGGFIHQVWVTFGENVVNVTGEATVSNRSSERHSNLSPSVTILWKYLCSEKKAYELWEAHVYVFNNRKFYNKKDFFEF